MGWAERVNKHSETRRRREGEPTPLLPSGFHPFAVAGLRRLCIDELPRSDARLRHMQALERLILDLEEATVPGEVWVGGSFMTTDPDPSDLDVAVVVPVGTCDHPTERQRQVLLRIQEADYEGCDSYLLSDCPPGHPHHRPEAIRDLESKLAGSRAGHPRGVAVIVLAASAPDTIRGEVDPLSRT